VGGATGSQHQYAQAADFHIEGVSAKALAEFLKTLKTVGGLALINGYSVHVDTRPRINGQITTWTY
jgi:uncharacterized protein YcbK (DUF882 family)